MPPRQQRRDSLTYQAPSRHHSSSRHQPFRPPQPEGQDLATSLPSTGHQLHPADLRDPSARSIQQNLPTQPGPTNHPLASFPVPLRSAWASPTAAPSAPPSISGPPFSGGPQTMSAANTIVPPGAYLAVPQYQQFQVQPQYQVTYAQNQQGQYTPRGYEHPLPQDHGIKRAKSPSRSQQYFEAGMNPGQSHLGGHAHLSGQAHLHRKNLSLSSHLDTISFSDNRRPAQHNFRIPNVAATPSIFGPTVSVDRIGPNSSHNIPSGPQNPTHGGRVNNERGDLQSFHNADMLLQLLIPQLIDVDVYNFSDFLKTVLVKCGMFLPLDEFYNMLYNPELYPKLLRGSMLSIRIDKSPPKPYIEVGAQVLYRILEVFKDPNSTAAEETAPGFPKSRLAAINFHELSRSFLAMKIIMDTIREVKSREAPAERNSMPRLLIYRAYYVICKKLISEYPTSNNSTSLQQKLILGPSKLGKLIKLVFPDLISKRLGPRTDSKFHYLGIEWNYDIIDDDILSLCSLDTPKIDEIFKNRRKSDRNLAVKKSRQSSSTSDRLRTDKSDGRSDSIPLDSRTPEVPSIMSAPMGTAEMTSPPAEVRKLSPYTFCTATSQYPKKDCTPDLYNLPCSEQPELSWMKPIKLIGAKYIERCGLNYDEFYSSLIDQNKMCEPSWLTKTVVERLKELLSTDGLTPEEQRRMQLTVLFSVLTKTLADFTATDLEDVKMSESRFRGSMGHMLKNFEHESSVVQGLDRVHVRIFLSILSRINMFCGLISTMISGNIVEEVLDELRKDLAEFLTAKDKDDGFTSVERFFFQGLIYSFEAYGGKAEFIENPTTERIALFVHDVTHHMSEVTAKIHDALLSVAGLICNLLGAEKQCLSFQIFGGTAAIIHADCFSHPLIRQIPLPVFTALAGFVCTGMEKASFQMYSRRTPELSRETFKIWWVFSLAVQVYIGLMAEIVAMGDYVAALE